MFQAALCTRRSIAETVRSLGVVEQDAVELGEGASKRGAEGDQGTLYDDVVLLLDDLELKASTSAPVVEADHGRIETYTATVSTEIDWLQKQHQWPALKAIGQVVRIRETAEKTTTETAYYLLSRVLSPERFKSGCAPALGREKQPALALGCGQERGSGPDPHGARTAKSRRAAPHGHPCHAEGRI